jgi:hypothetical protein
MHNFVTLNSITKSELSAAFAELGRSMKFLPEHIVATAHIKNQWFTPENINKAAQGWHHALRPEAVNQWLETAVVNEVSPKTGIIMAGNIPFVGLHDLLAVLASGHTALVKLSSQDEVLMGHAILILKQALPELNDRIVITESLKGIDYLIATGSNNSARYFEHYFSSIPRIIRKNRTSLAILTGNETEEELLALADDIYTYFGLGCRNITHLLLPRDFELKRLYDAYDKYIDIVNHHKYYNNYMYHKSILLMNLTKHYDNGFMLFQEKDGLHAPIATLNYHYYDEISEVNDYLTQHHESLQCVVSHIPEIDNVLAFGKAQMPELWDYADGVNTLEFLKH